LAGMPNEQLHGCSKRQRIVPAMAHKPSQYA
jgi:GTP cyclohydrolase I